MTQTTYWSAEIRKIDGKVLELDQPVHSSNWSRELKTEEGGQHDQGNMSNWRVKSWLGKTEILATITILED